MHIGAVIGPRQAIGDGFDQTPFDAANRLTTSIQSPCVPIIARVEAILLSGPAFWLELKKLFAVCCMDHITKKGKAFLLPVLVFSSYTKSEDKDL